MNGVLIVVIYVVFAVAALLTCLLYTSDAADE